MEGSKWPEVAGVGFVCAFGAVLARGWPSVDGSGWEAIGAIGSAASAIAAVGIAWWTQNESRRQHRIDAVSYALAAALPIARLRQRADEIFFRTMSAAPNEVVKAPAIRISSQIAALAEDVSLLDSKRLAEFESLTLEVLFSIKNELYLAENLAEFLPANKEPCAESLRTVSNLLVELLKICTDPATTRVAFKRQRVD